MILPLTLDHLLILVQFMNDVFPDAVMLHSLNSDARLLYPAQPAHVRIPHAEIKLCICTNFYITLCVFYIVQIVIKYQFCEGWSICQIPRHQKTTKGKDVLHLILPICRRMLEKGRRGVRVLHPSLYIRARK